LFKSKPVCTDLSANLTDLALGFTDKPANFVDGSQMELKVSTCILEFDVNQRSNLNGNAEYVVDGTEMGPEITRSKVKDSYEEPGIDAKNDDLEMIDTHSLLCPNFIPAALDRGLRRVETE
jgi:hypothetical protein